MNNIKVGAKTLVIILEYVLDIVETIEGIKGNKKKTLAIRLITKVVENAELEDDDRVLCMAMINNGIIGDTIDLVINAVNGKLDFEQVVETGSKCCVTILLKLLNDGRNKRKERKRNEWKRRVRANINNDENL